MHYPDHLKMVAKEAIETFAEIAAAAWFFRAKAEKNLPVLSAAWLHAERLSHVNILTFPEPVDCLINVTKKEIQDARDLCSQPALARVVVQHAKEIKTYYVCPVAPPCPATPPFSRVKATLASCDSPIGNLANCPIDGRLLGKRILDSGESVEILELAQFFAPVADGSGWDFQTTFYGDGYGSVVFRSLRKFLEHAAVAEKTGLMHQQQSSQMLLLGKLGASKTLMQYLDIGRSWVMFTLTDSVKQSAEMAFNLEGVLDSGQHIHTWVNFRNRLAHGEFGILGSAGSYNMWMAASLLETDAETKQIELFTDFDQFQKSLFWGEMRPVAKKLSENSAPEAARLGAEISDILAPDGTATLPDILASLIAVSDEIRELTKSMPEMKPELRYFAYPARHYINGIPSRYHRFRRAQQEEQRWYRAESFNTREIRPLEVDVILLAMLQNTRDLVARVRTISDNNPARATLNRLQNLSRMQVLVDEAADFSPLQLASIAALACPETRLLLAGSGFNQRGIESSEEARWAVPGIAIRMGSASQKPLR